MTERMPAASEANQELVADALPHFSTVEEAHENGFTESITASSELDKKISQTHTYIQLLHARHGELALVRMGSTAHYEVLARTPEAEEATVHESRMRRFARTVFGR